MLGDRLWDVGRARVNALYHQGLHRDGLVESVEIELIKPGFCPGFEFGVLWHLLTPLAFTRTLRNFR
jgi:hypothetical protein